MSLEKITVVDRIEVVGSGVVQVRKAVRILENGTVIGHAFERCVINPGDDYAGEDDRVQAICAATHTADVIAAYKAAIAAKGV